jgi:heme exporter protein D
MIWGSWSEFWAMGGYASFVWGSYGVTVAALAVEIWLARRRRRLARDEVERIRRRGA